MQRKQIFSDPRRKGHKKEKEEKLLKHEGRGRVGKEEGKISERDKE